MIIEEFDFFQQLTPRDQTLVIDVLFGSFKEQFSYYFEGCERGFVNEMIIRMYARVFKSGDLIINAKNKLTEVCFIFKGQMGLSFP